MSIKCILVTRSETIKSYIIIYGLRVSYMRKQIKGIALILFSILLILTEHKICI